MTAYADLMQFTRETLLLAQVAGRLDWDQEAIMPRGAAPQRAEEVGAMARIMHARRTDPRIGDWLEAANPEDDVARRQLHLIRREYQRAIRVPADLASALASTASRSQGEWARARAAEDFDAFAPVLGEIINLARQRAEALSDGGNLYDALVQDHEPGSSGAEIQTLFDALRPGLVDLRERILGSDRKIAALEGHFPRDKQFALTHELAGVFGYNYERGRLDLVTHPFCSGAGLDIRITTRVAETNPFDCFHSTIHETGHAGYEQNIDHAYLMTPIGQGVSMGVHESQSRIYENQIGRSRAFLGWLYGKMTDRFGALSTPDADAFYAAANRVAPGYIRTEADEVHYNLHVMLRFDLERKLISGELDVADLPDAWNERFAADFGVKVDKPSHGCLQDPHWAFGEFGYFPTYTLGNVYAGCLNEAMRADLPDLDAALAQGDTSPATTWLTEKVHRHGARYEARDVIERACGTPPSEKPLLAYLNTKFGALYDL